MATSSSSIHTLSLLTYSPKLIIKTTTHYKNNTTTTFLFFHYKNNNNNNNNPLLPFTHNTKNIKHFLKPLCFSSNHHSHFSIPTSNFFSFFKHKLFILFVSSFLFMLCLFNNYYYNNNPVFAHIIEKTEEQGKDDDSDMYEKLLERNPRDVSALKVVFHQRMGKGKTSEAVLYVERLIEIEPNEVEWRLLKAICYEMMGKFSKAKKLFQDILDKRPLLLRALHGLAMVMHKNHEGPAVFEMLNKALELARREKRVTEEKNIRILIAQIHVVKGDLEEGLKHFQALVDENPRDFRPYLCQGIIYSLLDKKNEAAEQFELYRSLVPDEFPQRGFLDDVVLAAKTSSHEQLEKDFQSEYSQKNN